MKLYVLIDYWYIDNELNGSSICGIFDSLEQALREKALLPPSTRNKSEHVYDIVSYKLNELAK